MITKVNIFVNISKRGFNLFTSTEDCQNYVKYDFTPFYSFLYFNKKQMRQVDLVQKAIEKQIQNSFNNSTLNFCRIEVHLPLLLSLSFKEHSFKNKLSVLLKNFSLNNKKKQEGIININQVSFNMSNILTTIKLMRLDDNDLKRRFEQYQQLQTKNINEN